ncbi:hypothetical protein BDM02DRAFT_328960 [Thelephora ganbajun]|uniref:Uncharacterized protein n=1 Tax=Thelephora ganbajun TaxID=370292 RepID=A0ACB6ZRE4_THEGA|nr:hypothetical protein BDM02DRAFT_328960 [Thelephora ganbajun]
MAPKSTTSPVTHSFLEQDYEYDRDNDLFLFYPSRPAFESSRDNLFPPYPTGFYNLPVFRNDREHLPLPPRPTESVYSDTTAVSYVDEDFYGREGNVLRSMGYSHCFCVGLISVGVPGCLHLATAHDFIPTPTTDRAHFTLSNFFAKLWDKILSR